MARATQTRHRPVQGMLRLIAFGSAALSLAACGQQVRAPEHRTDSVIAFGLDSPSQHGTGGGSALVFGGPGVARPSEAQPEHDRRDLALAYRTTDHVSATDEWPGRARPDLGRTVIYFAGDRDGRRSTFFRDERQDGRRHYRGRR